MDVGLNLNNDATDFFNQADDIDFGIKNFKNVKSSPLTFLLAWVSGQVTFSDIQSGQIAQKLQKFELSRKEARKQISDSVKSTFFEILTFKWLRVFLKKVVSEKEDLKVESFTIGQFVEIMQVLRDQTGYLQLEKAIAELYKFAVECAKERNDVEAIMDV